MEPTGGRKNWGTQRRQPLGLHWGVGEEVCNSQRDKKFKILVITIDVTSF